MNKIEVDKYRFDKAAKESYMRIDKEQIFSEIKSFLTEEGVPMHLYFIGKPDMDNRLCLYEDGDMWVVSFSERGVREDPSFFVGYPDAVNFFVWKLTKPKTIDWKNATRSAAL